MRSLFEANQAAAVYWTARRESVGISYVARDGTTETTARELQVVAPMLEELIEPGGRILDFGCGTGRFREILKGKAASYDGVDLIPGLSTVDWDFETLPGGYDEVLAAFVLQHITDAEAYAHWVQQLYDCLKPGGILFVVDHESMEEFDAHSRSLLNRLRRRRLASRIVRLVGITPTRSPRTVIPGAKEPHMLPRGLLAVLGAADWVGSKCLPMQYPDHWFALFVKRPIELPTDPAPVFETNEGGLVFARTIPMPEKISIDGALLDQGGAALDGKGGGWMTRNGDVIDFRLANGRWVYRIIGWGGHGQDIAVAELEYSAW